MPRPNTLTPSVALLTSYRPPFDDPPQASAPTPIKPKHYAPALDAQSAQNPKRKDGYQHSFNNGKRGRHSNHHQSCSNNPPKTNNRASLPFEPKPRFEVFTTLNTTYENVLVNKAPIIPIPIPRRPTNKPMPNTSVLCRFHQCFERRGSRVRRFMPYEARRKPFGY
ncbi:unnamed protein product [Prunus armeniaca]